MEEHIVSGNCGHDDVEEEYAMKTEKDILIVKDLSCNTGVGYMIALRLSMLISSIPSEIIADSFSK